MHDIGKHARLFALLGLLLVASAAVSFLLYRDVNAILVALFLLAIIGIFALLLLKEPSGSGSPAGAAIKAVATLATTFPGWSPATQKAAATMGVAQAVTWQGQLVPLVVFVVGSVVIGGIAIFAQRPPLTPATSTGASPFRERTYNQRFRGVARVLRSRLDSLDDQTNWTDQSFEPLDAEVEEISRSQRKTRKVGDLLSAIKRDRRSRVFLVIGEPGSGKSTALRKLAKDLLEAAPRTEILPLYINLKEWKGSVLASGEPPSATDLYDFVADQVKKIGDIYVTEFLEQYLRPMVEHGRIFFIFDSFDEIPVLLDQDETSQLIADISQIVGNMASGATQARGVIASRPYRQPRLIATEYKRLDVRPFSESKIRSALLRNTGLSREKVNGFMRGPPRWIASARNPFVANLICQFLQANPPSALKSQIALYEGYIDGRLGKFERELKANNLTVAELKAASSEIARFMFTTQGVGLEATRSELDAVGFPFPLDEVLFILESAKIIRRAPGPEQSVSFVHRRFYEFFLVQHLRQQQQIDLTAIEEDRRERDALVLYAEIADDAHARQIVQHCWSFIEQAWVEADELESDANLKAIYCLRFLVDAFSRTDSSALRGIEAPLSILLEAHIRHSFDLPLIAKISVEASGLFDDRTSAELIEQALQVGEPWVAETAIRSCRYVSSGNSSLRRHAEDFVITASDHSITTLGRDFGGLFDAADVLRPLKPLFRLRRAHVIIRRPLWLIAVVASPLLAATSALVNAILVATPLSPARPLMTFELRAERSYFSRVAPVITSTSILLFLLVWIENGSVASIKLSSETIIIAKIITLPFMYFINLDITAIILIYFGGISILISENFIPIGRIFSTSTRFFENLYAVVRNPSRFRSLFLSFDRDEGSVMTDVFISVAAVIAGSALMGGIVIGLVFLVVYLDGSFLPGIGVVALWLLAIALLVWIATSNWPHFRNWCVTLHGEWRDRRELPALGLRQLASREDITTAFNTPRTAKGRLRVVQELGLRSRQEGWRPGGEWPGARLPARGDTASSELARLEEQWRGLDR